MNQREETTPLLTNMLTVYIESRLASPSSGHVAVEINPQDTIRDIINSYLFPLQDDVRRLVVFDNYLKELDWDVTAESQGFTDGTKLYLCYDKTNLLQPVHITVIGWFTLIIGVILLIVSTVLFSSTGGIVPFDFGIVIDAGSTHTEVFLYQWSGSKDRGTGRVYQKDSCEYEVGVADDFDPDAVVYCVNNLTSQIPSGVSVPGLYLGATGGMRLLSLTNPKDVNLILLTLRYALETSSAQVRTIDIIQGEDEALFSWISTNFLTQILTKNEVQDTYGALDMGGASTQYAYAVKSPKNSNFSEAKVLNLYGHQYQVASKSFLCFGYFQAMDRFEALLLLKYRNATVMNPCLPVGLSSSRQADSFSLHPCIQNKNLTDWLYNDSTIDKLVINGSSNYSECKKNMPEVLDENLCKDMGFRDCISSINLSSLNIKFMAFSGFYYVIDFFNPLTSLEEFINGTMNWCHLTWKEIKEKVPESQYEHVARYCFAAVYITELLTSKYGFDSSTWMDINFTKQIDNTDVGWSLGLMINATNAIPEESPSPPVISLAIFAPLIIISLIMIFIAVLILRNNIRYYCRETNLLE